MGNYISTNTTKLNALKLVARYMVEVVPMKWWNDEYRDVALKTSKEVFKRIAKLSAAPIKVLEDMLDELELYSYRNGDESYGLYYVGTEVVSDILHQMS